MSTKLAAYVVGATALATALATGAGAGASAGGRLDRSFGDGGRVVIGGIRECFPAEGGCRAGAGVGMALQRNGAIVVAGGTLDSGCRSRFAVVRLRKTGSLDRTFGGDGPVLTSFGSSSAVAHAVVVLPDTRLVVGGELLDHESPCVDPVDLGSGKGFALARYRADGTLDPSFGHEGRVVTQFDEGAGLDVLLRPDGKLVVVGVSKGRLALARYSRDGTLDPSFGRHGTVTGDFQEDVLPGKAALDKRGRILVPISGCGSYFCTFVVRYKADGRLDRTFGRKGRAVVDLLSVSAVAMFGGRVVVAGLWRRCDVGCELAVLRLSSAGKLDRSFGRNGRRLLPDSWALQPDLAIQKNGKIVVAAGARPPRATGLDRWDFDFVLGRLLPNGALDRRFGHNGVVRDDFGSSAFGQAVAVQPNGKLLIAGMVGDLADDVGLARHLP
jgi:uncharacterized delta-60 repeat protein